MCNIGRWAFYAFLKVLNKQQSRVWLISHLSHWPSFKLKMGKEQPVLPTTDQSRSSPFLTGKRKIEEYQLHPVFCFLTKQTSLRPKRADVCFFDDGNGRQALCCGQDRVQVESWGSPRCRPRKLSRGPLRFEYGRYWSDKEKETKRGTSIKTVVVSCM